ncbi:hypothetical protein G6O69_17700 [Pseudenhygromyxa sp. WMMC2535]|uniref:hypothetical protein n=1 Tax=Pseudenhygromyxa sp. WMMC2535 TaxID=2712867 RepID=UPI001551C241|nr:hypothetical protein [Pseudenhygromyxa sp. WMMC2535]NVB39682.1 hypothetical protein [Pseudenhygromyxa sp. WMMC2535]
MPWAIAILALIGLVQSAVWIGQASAPVGRRLLAVFLAPLAALTLVAALTAIRVDALL